MRPRRLMDAVTAVGSYGPWIWDCACRQSPEGKYLGAGFDSLIDYLAISAG